MDIEALREACHHGCIEWTTHILNRFVSRAFTRESVIHALNHGFVIEDYPEDVPYPSCLVLGRDVHDSPMHIVCAFDGTTIWMVTVYKPDDADWNEDYSVRRKGD